MRTYGQWCSMAKALDVVGDRWTLLIVRELLLQGPCRFTDLRNGLPGIATNLLSTRIKEMEETGLIRREAAPPPVATTLFHLTELGRGLEPALQALTVWGIQVKGERRAADEFRSHWMTYPLHSGAGGLPPGRPARDDSAGGERRPAHGAGRRRSHRDASCDDGAGRPHDQRPSRRDHGAADGPHHPGTGAVAGTRDRRPHNPAQAGHAPDTAPGAGGASPRLSRLRMAVRTRSEPDAFAAVAAPARKLRVQIAMDSPQFTTAAHCSPETSAGNQSTVDTMHTSHPVRR